MNENWILTQNIQHDFPLCSLVFIDVRPVAIIMIIVFTKKNSISNQNRNRNQFRGYFKKTHIFQYKFSVKKKKWKAHYCQNAQAHSRTHKIFPNIQKPPTTMSRYKIAECFPIVVSPFRALFKRFIGLLFINACSA